MLNTSPIKNRKRGNSGYYVKHSIIFGRRYNINKYCYSWSASWKYWILQIQIYWISGEVVEAKATIRGNWDAERYRLTLWCEIIYLNKLVYIYLIFWPNWVAKGKIKTSHWDHSVGPSVVDTDILKTEILEDIA